MLKDQQESGLPDGPRKPTTPTAEAGTSPPHTALSPAAMPPQSSKPKVRSTSIVEDATQHNRLPALGQRDNRPTLEPEDAEPAAPSTPATSSPVEILTQAKHFCLLGSPPNGKETKEEPASPETSEASPLTSVSSSPTPSLQPELLETLPNAASREPQLAISSTSASIKLEDLASLSPSLSKALAAHPLKANNLISNGMSLQKDPIPFMRLPLELRNMVYRRIWTVVSCPYKVKLKVGYHYSFFVTGAVYWIGPAPGVQVQYPNGLMTVDSRIKREFVRELCANFPLQMSLNSFIAEKVPNLSIQKSSLFLTHLRDCQVHYSSHKRDSFGRSRGFKDFNLISTDFAELGKVLHPLPCLRRLVVYTSLDPVVHHPDNNTYQSGVQALVKSLFAKFPAEVRSLVFATIDHDWSLCIGYDTSLSEYCRAHRKLRRTCTATSGYEHDIRNCDSIRCRCKFRITQITNFVCVIYNFIQRALALTHQWAVPYYNFGAQVILFFIGIYKLSKTDPRSGFSPDKWRKAPLHMFFKYHINNADLVILYKISCNAWTARNTFHYNYIRPLIHSFATRTVANVARFITLANSLGAPSVLIKELQDELGFYQALAADSGSHPHLAPIHPRLEREKQIWHSVDRFLSFIIHACFGVLIWTYIHVNTWILIAFVLFILPSISVLLVLTMLEEGLSVLRPREPFARSTARLGGAECRVLKFKHANSPTDSWHSTVCHAVDYTLYLLVIVCWMLWMVLMYGPYTRLLLRTQRQNIAASIRDLKRDLHDFARTTRALASKMAVAVAQTPAAT